ncbi:MAG: hypothetical protein LUE16_00675, partial [Lachnospiraceae bacterium]|nr:hypothetical protein [Lachnospiraceae bacterium]
LWGLQARVLRYVTLLSAYFPRTDYDDNHVVALPNDLVYDTDTCGAQLDFQKPREIVATFVSQRFSEAAFRNGERVFTHLVDGLTDKFPLAALKDS